MSDLSTTPKWPRKGLALLLSLSLLAQACTPMPRQTDESEYGPKDCRRLGTLRLGGEARVYLNQRPARDREAICSGDHLATGHASTAWVDFDGGGQVQLDENSDPIFRVLQELVIEILNMQTGQLSATSPPGGKLVFQNADARLETAGTQFNLKVSASQTLLTVVEGRVRVLRPPLAVLKPREMVALSAGNLQYRRLLSPQELNKVIQWRNQYPDRPKADPSEGDGVSAWIGPALIAVGVGAVLNHIFQDDKRQPDVTDGKDRKPSLPSRPTQRPGPVPLPMDSRPFRITPDSVPSPANID